MKIAALSQYYIPYRNAGSEVMLHTMLRRLVEDGHEVAVFTCGQKDVEEKYTSVDGVAVFNSNLVLAQQLIKNEKPDLIIAQHNPAFQARRLADQVGCPWALLVHSDPDFVQKQLRLGADLVVFNSSWLQDKYRATMLAKDSVVVHPPVIPEDHATTPGDCVTLVNLCRDKGGDRLYWMAEAFPEKPFLGVEGGYQTQIRSDLLPNVSFVPQTTDMKNDVWARTRVLLMPSVYESYGMAGVEAMASGIPVIAHPTPGLLESLDYAGIFVHRDDVDGMADALESLDDPEYYQERSELALKRSADLDPRIELDVWSDKIERITCGTGETGFA